MPKLQQKGKAPKRVAQAPSISEESFDDESYESMVDAPEVNREHLLNYQSDSDDSGLNDSDNDNDDGLDLAKGLSNQKQALVMNDTWGGSKKNFYGRDKKRDDEDSSDDNDEDEYQEAIRLQKVRARKLM